VGIIYQKYVRYADSRVCFLCLGPERRAVLSSHTRHPGLPAGPGRQAALNKCLHYAFVAGTNTAQGLEERADTKHPVVFCQ